MTVQSTAKTIEELYDKIKDPKVVSKILQDAKIPFKIIELINEESFCETFHKLPSEVREMNIFDYDVYSAILSGRQDAIRNKD